MSNEETFDEAFENEFDEEQNKFSEDENDKDIVEWPIIIALDYPVQFGKRKVESVQIKNELTVAMMQHLPLDPSIFRVGHIVPLIADMIGESQELIKLLNARDYSKLATKVTSFLASGQ